MMIHEGKKGAPEGQKRNKRKRRRRKREESGRSGGKKYQEAAHSLAQNVYFSRQPHGGILRRDPRPEISPREYIST